MNTLKDYVNYKLTHADKVAEAESYPLTLTNCKKYKKMRDLKVYGNSLQDGTPTPENPIEVQSVGKLVTDTTDINYGKYKIPVVQRGINLFCLAKTDATVKTINGLTFTPLDDERVYVKGTATANIYYYMNAKATKNMVLKSGRYKSKPFNKSEISILFNVRYMDGTGAGNLNSMHSGVTYNNDIYIESALIYVAKGTVMDDIIELQLMEGNQNLPYEPYIEPVTTNIFLDEPLRKLGDYADYIDFRENKVVRNVRELVFKGGEIDNVFTGYAPLGYNLYRTKVNFVNNAYTKNFNSWLSVYPEKSTHFKASTFLSSSDMKINQWAIKVDYALHFTLAPETYAGNGVNATAKDINNWLASQYENGTPVIFDYILVDPTEEPINIDLPKFTTKTTIIEVDTSLAPSNIYGKYIKK